MDRADAIDHLSQGKLACRDETVLILLCDTVCVSRQHNQISLCVAHKQGLVADGRHGGAPDGLIMAADFDELVIGTVAAWDVFYDANAFHEIGYDDNVVDDGDINGGCRGPETGKFLKLH